MGAAGERELVQRLPARARSAAAIRGELVSHEHRDPTAATRPVQWLGRDMPQVNEWDAEQAFRCGVMANVVAFRCVEVWADTISAFPFRAGLRPPDRPGAKADFNPQARLAQLLGPPPGGPNRNISGRGLIRWTVVQRFATGRHYWEIEYDNPRKPGEPGNPVLGFWPMPAAHVADVPTQGTNPEYFKAYVYPKSDPNPRTLSPKAVFHGWSPSGTDVRQPVAPLQAARYPLSIAVMGDRSSFAFLKNGSVPAAVVTTTEFADDDQRENFRRQWHSQYQGPDNAGATAFHEVSEGGPDAGPVGETIDVKVLGLSAKDSQFVQQHLASLKEVAWGLGVPWSKIDSADRTFSNAEAEERAWILEKVVPFLAILEDEINLRLAPLVGPEVGWFDLSGLAVLRPTPRFTAMDVPALLAAAVISREEARGEFGLDPDALPEMPDSPALPSGSEDGRQVDQGAGSLSGHGGVGGDAGGGSAPRGGSVDPGGRGRDGLGTDGLVYDGRAGPRSQAHTPPDESRVLTQEEQETRRALIWKRHDATVRTLEATWERAWQRLFRRQANATLGKVNGRAAKAKLGAAIRDRELRVDPGTFDARYWAEESAEVARGLYEQVVSVGFARVSDRFGISFDVAQPYVQDFIGARANQLAGQVTTTTYEAIQSALAEGVGAGESIPDLAGRVSHVFDVASGSRATTIARTEVVSASNASASLAAAQLPSDVVGGQEWIATADGRTREDHLALDGEVIAIGEAFSNGLAYPGDPSGDPADTVNCRCTVAFLTPDEMADVGRSRSRVVPLGVATLAIRTLRPGDEFDEREFRRSLVEVAA